MDLCWQSNSLLFNMLSRLVITFLTRSKCLLISWLQSPSAVILEPKIIKSLTVSIVSPSICHEVMGPDAMILVFWMLSFFILFYFIFKLYIIVLVLPNIKMNPPQVYMKSVFFMATTKSLGHNISSKHNIHNMCILHFPVLCVIRTELL